MSAIAMGITAKEAMILWRRSGHPAKLLVSLERAAQQAGLRLEYARWGDQLLIETSQSVGWER